MLILFFASYGIVQNCLFPSSPGLAQKEEEKKQPKEGISYFLSFCGFLFLFVLFLRRSLLIVFLCYCVYFTFFSFFPPPLSHWLLFVVWVNVVDKEGAEIGDVTQVELDPEASVDLRKAVVLEFGPGLSHTSAPFLRVFAAGANPKEDQPLRPPDAVPEGTSYDAPLIILAPGKFLLFFLRVV